MARTSGAATNAPESSAAAPPTRAASIVAAGYVDSATDDGRADHVVFEVHVEDVQRDDHYEDDRPLGQRQYAEESAAEKTRRSVG